MAIFSDVSLEELESAESKTPIHDDFDWETDISLEDLWKTEKLSNKVHYIVIAERHSGGYDIWLNDQFDCQGGRRLNKDFVENLFGARKIAQKMLARFTSYSYVKIVDDNLDIVETDEIAEIRIRAQIVEIHINNELAPHFREQIIDKPAAPDFDKKIGLNSKLFLNYCRVAKLYQTDKSKDINYLGRYYAYKLKRKWCRPFALMFLGQIERLQKASKTNLGMQSLLIQVFKTTKLPTLGPLTIPTREEIVREPAGEGWAITKYGSHRN